MKNQPQKKLLLALDGSENSFDAVRYVRELDPFHKMKVVLFNVFSSIPEFYWDLEKDLQSSQSAREIRSWEMHQREVIQKFMDKAKQSLLSSGFSQDSVIVKIQNRNKGIARDIILEAKDGYSAIAIGRKSKGIYKEIIVGSVATKIIEKLAFIPVLMIGKVPLNKNILVALDSSENAMRAVDYVATTLGGFDFKTTLLHVIRGVMHSQAEIPDLFLPKIFIERAEKEINDVFDKAKQCLTDAGFKSNQITTKIILDAHSRAGAIIHEAREGDYGTIVLGRRGLSRAQEFFMGRVSSKVIHTIRNRAVWVVT